MNRDEMQGKAEKAKGYIKDKAGEVLNDPDLEAEGVKWAREIMGHSPLAIRCLKSAFNADVDGQSGLQELAGNATLLYYMSEEAKEFHGAQREKRKPDARKFPWLP